MMQEVMRNHQQANLEQMVCVCVCVSFEGKDGHTDVAAMEQRLLLTSHFLCLDLAEEHV